MLPADSNPRRDWPRASLRRRSTRPGGARSGAVTRWLGALAIAAGAWLSACSSANPVLTFFFDGVPAPGQIQPSEPPKHAPRRLPYKPPPPKVFFVEIPDLPPAIDWRARFDALTRNEDGEVEWIKALDDQTITPKPGIATDAKDGKVMDLDLEFIPEGKPKYKVVFRHEPHTKLLRCANCHDGIFEKEQGAAAMTMKNLKAGAYCGVCHGKVALPELDNCTVCHKDM